MILVLDNYDSFVHNLARQLRLLGQAVVVRRNDESSLREMLSDQPEAIVISPGPGKPEEAGVSLELVREMAGRIPLLGVCLGHQVICQALGGLVRVSGNPVHGSSSLVHHSCEGLFSGLPNPLRVGRYHSLIAEPRSLPAELEVTAWLDDGTVMAVQHRKFLVAGVQFHPESILTECGPDLLANFLVLAGLGVSRERVQEMRLEQNGGAGVPGWPADPRKPQRLYR